MVASTKILMTDLSRQKSLEVQLSDELTPNHTVGQTIDYFKRRRSIPDNGFRWAAFRAGVKLDNKRLLRDLPDTNERWLVVAETSAGARNA